MNSLLRTILILLAVATFSGCRTSLKSEDVFSTAQKDNAAFSVKITAHRESRSFGQVLGGAYYVFEAKRKDDPNWKRFLMLPYDDPEPVDKRSIELVDEKTGYVFMHRKFAVTTNAGTSWSDWDVSNIDTLKGDRSCWIDYVSIAQTGSGTMGVKCDKSGRSLSTTDFGVTWKE
jgi:hypothetical protein